MLPAGLMAKAIHLCAAGLSTAMLPPQSTENLYAVVIHSGAQLLHQPDNLADAQATVRDLLALGADFDAGPLAINGRDFASYGVTSASVFDPCALSHVDDALGSIAASSTPTVSTIAALVHQAFGARITDTLRPVNASYGALHSWHKVGQAVDFVPAGGVLSITRAQIRALMAAHGIRLLELLGPGDSGHSNHWHVAFARPGQVIDHIRQQEGDEDWIVAPASDRAVPTTTLANADAPTAPVSAPSLTAKAPPHWDVFALAQWRAGHGGGS